MNIAIDVRGAVKRYGDFIALQGVDLAVYEGEFLGFWDLTVLASPH